MKNKGLLNLMRMEPVNKCYKFLFVFLRNFLNFGTILVH